MFRYLPEQASQVASEVDWLHYWITDLAVFFTVAICGSMVYFAIRYRRRNGVDHETPRIEGSNFLEIVWTVVPTIISIIVAYYGVVIYNDLVRVDKDAMVINVEGRQWAWDFQYDNGKTTTGELYIPVGKPVQLVLTSKDVLHSFFVPSMRVKKDAVPGRFTYVSFTPIRTGDYNVFCTEYCGMNHSQMLAKLHVRSEAEFAQWKNDRSAELASAQMSPFELGKQLFTSKGCNACHTLNGAPLVGPSYLHLFGSKREFTDGTTLAEADDDYIRESILNPSAKVEKGYAPIMPSFDGQLSDQEILGLIAFIRAYKDGPPAGEEAPAAAAPAADPSTLSPVERGKIIYETKLCKACHTLDGSSLVGPTFKGIYGRKGELADGSSYVANEEYIKHSMLMPNDQVVKGFAPAMPSFEGQLSDDQINDVIAFMKSISE